MYTLDTMRLLVAGLLLAALAMGGFATQQPTRADGWAFCADIDGDNSVTISDIFLILGNFGESWFLDDGNPHFDINGDGIVSVYDVFYVAAHFGLTCDEKETVLFETIDHGPWSGVVVHPAELRIADTQSAWQALWQEHTSHIGPVPPPLPKVDFEHEMIIGLFDAYPDKRGVVAIEAITAGSYEWTVEATIMLAGRNCMISMAFGQPNHIVKIPRTDLPIHLSLNQFEFACPK